MKYISYLLISILFTSCVSTQSTLKNVDKTALRPLIKDKAYIITEYATDSKYAYDQDYPINIGNIRENQEDINVSYYFNGLEGPNGEKISYKKIDTCCPFPTTNTTMGAGTIGIYEITFEGSNKKATLYINIYEKGKLLCPKGFSIKKFP
ncbi:MULTISPECIES: 2-dehydro-3-deoxyphosphooctonate aldolase [unclassified Flavobacterium]|uniref:2-dehydro-3-deoxyphosphooctonate aldolase n=1 Tax=unclassified Flavobacterium TaxID=196869 RepID=UPI001291BCB2|nr:MULTISPECIES: 2-dehydro-3-deoxyphosphooctonate aldolase [unclassified Flavobacterium]MQP52442.1 2-dehydro-3-deoxyphosphooctonate aldolase [Flavobacterium sp. LMO9]MQP62512.1 2-dehydro-3-deoxyphosphooctonate aldolase [Flavobacterium sp. LMO6]